MELGEKLTRRQRWELAVRTKRPTDVARVFAGHAGQFYDRSDFDTLARRVRDLYDQTDADRAEAFRRALDRRLYDRYHTGVVWDVTPERRGTA